MKNPHWIKRNEKGFSFLEIITTCGILGILATIAIPVFSTWLPDYRLKGAVQEIYSNLQLTKMEAVKINEDRSIVFNAGVGTYTKPDGTTVTLSEYGASVTYGGGNAGGGVDGEDFDNFITYSAPDDVASFNSRGMGNNNGSGYVYLTNSKNRVYAVGSLTSGVIVLKRWNGSDWE
jgi:Tfp pilus assembly protein FimT